MARSFFRRLSALLGFAALGGCAAHNPAMWQQPALNKPSPMKEKLAALPPPGQRLAVAVYGFTDQTGQFRHSDTVQTLSRAVTQGATSILVKTLQDTGQRQWFQVIERERLDNVLRERAVIREMRSSYLGEKTVNPEALPPLLFAGVLLEGGIIGYDANTKSGGAGARLLGIGGSTQYREDTITVYLRAVSVKSGEVLASVSVRKSLASVSLGGNAFRYIAFKDLLEAEAGVAFNEPDEIALTQAIEKAVYALIMEGALDSYWCLSATPDQARRLLQAYIAERDPAGARRQELLARLQRSPQMTAACSAQQVAALRRPVLREEAMAASRAAPPASAPVLNYAPTVPAMPEAQAAAPRRQEGG